MTLELLIVVTCNDCGVHEEGESGLPEGWVFLKNGKHHRCPECFEKLRFTEVNP